MENKIQVFENSEFGNIRVIEQNGEPWFMAADVCRALELDPTATRRLDDDEKNTLRLTQGTSGNPNATMISEAGLYTLVLGSRKPEAKQFKRWVTHDVLPTIRKHGMYVNDELLFDPDLAIAVFQALKDERTQRKALEATVAAQHEQISVMKPKATYCDQILQCENAMPITIIAKDYGMSATALNRKLNELRIQYKRDETWVLYQKYAGQGYISTETFWYESNGRKKARISTKWTQKGRLFLYDRLKAAGILPECEENDSEKNTALVS